MEGIGEPNWREHRKDLAPGVGTALAAIMALTFAQREELLRLFCRYCRDYMGPDDCCYCSRDD